MPAGNWYLLLPTLLLTLTADAFRAPLSWPAHRRPRRHHHGRSSSASHGDDDGLVTVPDDKKKDKIGRTTATRGVMPRPPQPQHSDRVRPPPYLNDLAVGECVHLGDNIRIVKVSHDPPIFYLPQFLDETDCRTIMDAVADNMSSSETKQGVVEHRTGSTVAWLGDQDDDDHGDGAHHGGDDDDDPTRHFTMLAGYLQHLTAHLFLPHALTYSSSVDAERLQVVRYDMQGRYDLHHDGYDRTVTVLTYLNGVAGTWFPFVKVNDDENDDGFIPTMQLGNENMLNGRVPGRDGLCFVGREDNTIVPPPPARGEEERGNAKGRVVRVDTGDAICFYNYQPLDVPPNDDDDVQRRRSGNATDHAGDNDDATKNIIMAWKTLHCGLPAPTTKWIATNWLSAVVEKAVVPPQEED
jgi:hypothetical protein